MAQWTRDILLILFVFFLLTGFSSVNISPTDSVYRDIEKFQAFDLVRTVLWGQRPFARSEIGRILCEVKKNLDKKEEVEPDKIPSWIVEHYRKREKEFRTEMIQRGCLEGEIKKYEWQPLETVFYEMTLLDSAPTVIPQNNAGGRITASINPLTDYRAGRHYVDGFQTALEMTHRARLHKYGAFYLHPRFQFQFPRGAAGNDVDPIIHQLYGKFAIKNFEIQVGRDSLVWGQSPRGGQLLSANARPLDMIKLTSTSPFYHPWIFKYLGLSRWTFFVANLGPEREFPRSFLTGLKLTLKPVHFFEIGFSQGIIMGGEGAPALSVGDVIGSFFFNRIFEGGSSNSNHRFAGDLVFTIPHLRDSRFYYELALEDCCRNHMEDRFEHIVGFYVPRLTSNGKWDLRLEYHHTPSVAYRHSPFVTGWTLNRKIMGDNIGPLADAVYMDLTYQIASEMRSSLTFAFEVRDSDLFVTLRSGLPGANDVKVDDRPAEHRYRFVGSFEKRFWDYFDLTFRAGYELVEKYQFVAGDTRHNFLGEFSLKWNFEDWLHRDESLAPTSFMSAGRKKRVVNKMTVRPIITKIPTSRRPGWSATMRLPKPTMVVSTLKRQAEATRPQVSLKATPPSLLRW